MVSSGVQVLLKPRVMSDPELPVGQLFFADFALELRVVNIEVGLDDDDLGHKVSELDLMWPRYPRGFTNPIRVTASYSYLWIQGSLRGSAFLTLRFR